MYFHDILGSKTCNKEQSVTFLRVIYLPISEFLAQKCKKSTLTNCVDITHIIDSRQMAPPITTQCDYVLITMHKSRFSDHLTSSRRIFFQTLQRYAFSRMSFSVDLWSTLVFRWSFNRPILYVWLHPQTIIFWLYHCSQQKLNRHKFFVHQQTTD